MMNNVNMVGRLIDSYDVKINEDNKKYAIITIAIPRSFKNMNGEYDTDFVDVVVLGMVAENTCEYCRKGDIVGIRGRLETKITTDNEGNKTKSTIVVAERVSFLSSNKESEE